MRKPSAFEQAYEKYRELLEYETSRGVFCITSPTTHVHSADPFDQVEAMTKGVEKFDESLLSIPREYAALDNCVTDLRRQLDRKLYLLVKDETGQWTFPSFTASDDSTPLHKLAQLAITNLFSPDHFLDIYWVGSSPVSFHFERFSDRVKPPFGAKKFHFRAQLISGRVSFKLPTQFAWLTAEETRGYLDAGYFASVEPILSV